METQEISSGQIEGQIAAVDATLASLDQEASTLALDAVAGNQDAAKRLVEINAQIGSARADRDVLSRARATAVDREIAAYEAEREAEKARHLERAREHAGKLLALAERIDAVIAEFGVLTEEVSPIENSLRQELRLADALPKDSTPGRYQLVLWAAKNVNNVMSKGDFATKVMVTDVARQSWGYLTGEEGDHDL